MIRGSMCEIQRAQAVDGTSLGMFRPAEVQGLLFEEIEVDASKEAHAAALAAQGSLLDNPEDQARQRRVLEQMPYRFRFSYRCSDGGCSGHKQMIVDWEIAQFYRNIRNRPDWKDRMRAKWIGQLCDESRDTAFIVGNLHQHPSSFLVLGVWWPPKEATQLTLGADRP